jgi:hypothetical protein
VRSRTLGAAVDLPRSGVAQDYEGDFSMTVPEHDEEERIHRVPRSTSSSVGTVNEKMPASSKLKKFT